MQWEHGGTRSDTEFACHAATRDSADPAAAAVARACGQTAAFAYVGGRAPNLTQDSKRKLFQAMPSMNNLAYQETHVLDGFRIYFYGASMD